MTTQILTKTEKFNKMNLKEVPDVKPGDVVKVHQKIKEGNKERIQIFEGIIIAKKHGKGMSATFTARKVVQGVGVERIFPLHSPSIAKIEIVRSGKVRRAKLYYLRTAKGKKAKLKKKEFAEAIVDETPTENQPQEDGQNTADIAANQEQQETNPAEKSNSNQGIKPEKPAESGN